jgi:hypothetical protein
MSDERPALDALKPTFSSSLTELVHVWGEYRAKRIVNKHERAYELVTNVIPGVVRSWVPQPEKYIFAGRTGMTNISTAPYFGTFNPAITKGAKHGYYLVYLLSADLRRLVLQIGFGVYQFKDYYGQSRKMLKALDDASNRMRQAANHLKEIALHETASRTNTTPVKLDEKPGLLKNYERCAIFSLTYEVDGLPTEERLIDDYLEYLRLYDLMSESLLLPEVESYLFESPELAHPQDELVDGLQVTTFQPRTFSKRNQSAASEASHSPRAYSKRADKAGRLGEEYVVKFEQRRLANAGRSDLAEQVVWHRECATNRTPGWDVSSFEVSGVRRYIEVKASDGKVIRDIELTKNEWFQAASHEAEDSYFVYLVSNVFGKPAIEILKNPARLVREEVLSLAVARYTLWLGARLDA